MRALVLALAGCGGLAVNATTPGETGGDDDDDDLVPLDTDADTDSDSDSDADSDSDSDADADADTDSDSDADTDTGTPGVLRIGDLAPGDLVITEIMQNPAAVDDTLGEWFEVVNASGSTVDLDGLVVEDDDTNSFTVTGALLVPPNGGVVFGREGDTGLNGGVGVDYVEPLALELGNSVDELVLTANGLEIDRVEWGDGIFPEPSGASMQLDPTTLDAVSNDDGTNWCEAVSVYGAGDLGTPGILNDPC